MTAEDHPAEGAPDPFWVPRNKREEREERARRERAAHAAVARHRARPSIARLIAEEERAHTETLAEVLGDTAASPLPSYVRFADWRTRLRVGAVMLPLLVVAAIPWSVAVWLWASGSEFTTGAFWIAVSASFPLLVLFIRGLRIRMVVTQQGVLVANVLATRTLDWDQIHMLRTGASMGAWASPRHAIMFVQVDAKGTAVIADLLTGSATATRTYAERPEQLLSRLQPVARIAAAHGVLCDFNPMSSGEMENARREAREWRRAVYGVSNTVNENVDDVG